MNPASLLIILCLMAAGAFIVGRGRSLALVRRGDGSLGKLNSLPFYYGALTALWCIIPSAILVLLWSLFDGAIIEKLVIDPLPASIVGEQGERRDLVFNQVLNLAAGHLNSDAIQPALLAAVDHLKELRTINFWAMCTVCISLGLFCALVVWLRIAPQFKARANVEVIFRYSLLTCASLAVLTTVGIIISVLFESIRFFQHVSIFHFLFGLEWSPQMAIRADQTGSSGSFGAVPIFLGTLLIAALALLVAVPTGLMSAIYLSEYASRRTRSIVKPALEVLAGVPTVVYGFFAALTVAPLIRDLGLGLGLDQWIVISSESALAAGLVMGVMIIPFVSSLSDDVINAVPQSLRDGALALGSTRSEVIKQVVLPAALPGVVGSILLAASRAIGETMIVVMAAGMAANMTINPFDAVTTVTVQIVTLLVGDQEFDSPKTLAAFALGLMLFVVTLCLNYLALYIVRKYREQYE